MGKEMQVSVVLVRHTKAQDNRIMWKNTVVINSMEAFFSSSSFLLASSFLSKIMRTRNLSLFLKKIFVTVDSVACWFRQHPFYILHIHGAFLSPSLV